MRGVSFFAFLLPFSLSFHEGTGGGRGDKGWADKRFSILFIIDKHSRGTTSTSLLLLSSAFPPRLARSFGNEEATARETRPANVRPSFPDFAIESAERRIVRLKSRDSVERTRPPFSRGRISSTTPTVAK